MDFVAGTGLDELIEVFAHGVLMQSGHCGQRRDRHGPGLCREVLVDEYNGRRQARLRDRRAPVREPRNRCLSGHDLFFTISIVINSTQSVDTPPGPASASDRGTSRVGPKAPPAGDPIHPPAARLRWSQHVGSDCVALAAGMKSTIGRELPVDGSYPK